MKEKGIMKFPGGSVIEIDAALDIAEELNYLENINIKNLGEYTLKTFKILSGLIEACTSH